MNTLFAARLFKRIACAAAISSLAVVTQAQTARPPGLKVVPQPAAPSRSVAPAAPAAPGSPAAAASPTPAVGFGAPSPAGLVSQFPAGLPSPNDTPPGSPAIDAGIASPNVMGAGAAVPRPVVSAGASGGYSAVQIAQSFLGADTNRDGELSRAEAQRLTIAPMPFEEMDRNRDNILTRFEYDDAFR
jgi:hypothetical protein